MGNGEFKGKNLVVLLALLEVGKSFKNCFAFYSISNKNILTQNDLQA